ncbi:rod-binding protein [Granulicella rosea]|nr:rod-binding protein [Granulicella rosea]
MPTFPGQLDADQVKNAKDAKLASSAQKFEGMFIQQMFKDLNFGSAPGDDESTGGANDTIRSMGNEAFADAIAKAGGFGVAKQVVRQVQAQHDLSETKQHSTKV